MKIVKLFIKFLVFHIFDLFGIHAIARSLQSSPVVLFWHGVSDYPNLNIEGESFPVDLFEKQIKYLVKHYEIISIDEYAKRYEKRNFNNREIVITFDDGYKNNLIVAAPILKKYNIPFTIFISAHNVDAQERFYISIPRLVIIGGQLDRVDIPAMDYHKVLSNDEERKNCAYEIEYTIKYYSHNKAKTVARQLVDLYGRDNFNKLCKIYTNGKLLTWDDVHELIDNYNCTIGSHCYDHCICHSNQDEATVIDQIKKSKELIERKTGLECKYFAYPNGDFSSFSDEVVKANYRLGFSTMEVPAYHNDTTCSSIGRIGVPAGFEEFKFFLSRFSIKKS